jgi:hypothetical protein
MGFVKEGEASERDWAVLEEDVERRLGLGLERDPVLEVVDDLELDLDDEDFCLCGD